MGLFYSDTTPGRGVSKGSPKNPFLRFFAILFRKFLSFINVSVIYAVAAIPTMIPVILIAGILTGPLVSGMEQGFASVMDLFYRVVCTYLFAILWGLGPASAGICYVTRNWADENHSWIWGDFKDAVKGNWKKTLIVYLTDLVIFVLVYLSLRIYGQMDGVASVLRYVVLGFMLVYTMMHFYIYPMIVTFNMKLRDIYLNSFLFAFGKFPTNLFILAVLLLLHLGGFCLTLLYNNGFILIVMILLESVFLFALSAYFINFHIYPTLKKYMKE